MLKNTLLLFLIFFTVPIFSQQHVDRLQGLDTTINQLMIANQTVGLAVAVIENNKLIYAKGFGYRDYAKKLTVTPNTIFPIGSVSKPLTASLIGVYDGRGQLSPSDKPRKHIDYLRFHTDEMNNLITIEDLLAHRSGIGVVDGTHVFFPTQNTKKHLQRLVHLPPSSEVREKFEYSNMGYSILGAITESISGKTWGENMETEIFAPLGMLNSSCNLTDLQAQENYALGYSLANDTIVQVLYEDQYESAPAGAINSSVIDLAKWTMMLLNGGKHNDQQLLPEAYLEAAFSEQNRIKGSFSYKKQRKLLNDSYGYGWFVHQYDGLYRINHGGNVSGFTADVTLYPYENIGIIILINQHLANHLNRAIEDIIMNQLLDQPKKPWQDYSIQIEAARMPITKFPSINQTQSPSHLLTDYCGKYESPAYGTLEVMLENNHLMIQFPAFKMALVHQQYDTFINQIWTPIHQNTPSFYLDFVSNRNGELTDLVIDFPPMPVRFQKIE